MLRGLIFQHPKTEHVFGVVTRKESQYDISLNESYLAEIRNMRTKEDWVLSNKINRILKDRETK